MARKRKKSDDVYNARRRFRRQAERYAKKAESTTGVASAKYRAIAQDAAEKALSTYQNKDAAQKGRVATVAQRVGASTETAEKYSRRLSKLDDAQLQDVLEKSSTKLSGVTGADLRDAEAKAILSKGNIGSRFYGSLVDIWQGSNDIDQAIKDYFGVDSIMDVLDELESVANIYDAPDETVNPSDGLSTLQIQRYVKQREKAL